MPESGFVLSYMKGSAMEDILQSEKYISIWDDVSKMISDWHDGIISL